MKKLKDWTTKELKEFQTDLVEQERFGYPSPKDVHNAIVVDLELLKRK